MPATCCLFLPNPVFPDVPKEGSYQVVGAECLCETIWEVEDGSVGALVGRSLQFEWSEVALSLGAQRSLGSKEKHRLALPEANGTTI